MHTLGERSLKNLEGVHPHLVEIVKKAIELSKVDFGILNNGGRRTAQAQSVIFDQGNSKCDGYIRKSYHQSGNAVDLVPYIDGKYRWSNKQAFIDILEAFQLAEKELKEKGIVPTTSYFHHGIYWGWYDMDMDGKLTAIDKPGWDSAHHELRNFPQNITPPPPQNNK